MMSIEVKKRALSHVSADTEGGCDREICGERVVAQKETTFVPQRPEVLDTRFFDSEGGRTVMEQCLGFSSPQRLPQRTSQPQPSRTGPPPNLRQCSELAMAEVGEQKMLKENLEKKGFPPHPKGKKDWAPKEMWAKMYQDTELIAGMDKTDWGGPLPMIPADPLGRNPILIGDTSIDLSLLFRDDEGIIYETDDEGEDGKKTHPGDGALSAVLYGKPEYDLVNERHVYYTGEGISPDPVLVSAGRRDVLAERARNEWYAEKEAKQEDVPREKEEGDTRRSRWRVSDERGLGDRQLTDEQLDWRASMEDHARELMETDLANRRDSNGKKKEGRSSSNTELKEDKRMSAEDSEDEPSTKRRRSVEAGARPEKVLHVNADENERKILGNLVGPVVGSASEKADTTANGDKVSSNQCDTSSPRSSLDKKRGSDEDAKGKKSETRTTNDILEEMVTELTSEEEENINEGSQQCKREVQENRTHPGEGTLDPPFDTSFACRKTSEILWQNQKEDQYEAKYHRDRPEAG